MSTRDELRLLITQLKNKIALADAVARLNNHPDFRLVFLNHTNKELPLQLVNEMSRYKLGSEEHNDLVSQLDHVSFIQAHLTNLIDEGQIAEQDLREAQAIPDSELN